MLVELLCHDGGRVAAVANGIKRKKSKLAGSLRPFNPVLTRLIGRGELKTMADAEAVNKPYKLSGTALYCGFYMNEISLKLLAKGEGGGDFFDFYTQTIKHLNNEQTRDLHLRYFEYALLKEAGLAFDFKRDLSAKKIMPDKHYVQIPQQGLQKSDATNPNAISGQCLQKFINHDTLGKSCLNKLKVFMRLMLNQALEGRPIKSRELLADYVKVKNG